MTNFSSCCEECGEVSVTKCEPIFPGEIDRTFDTKNPPNFHSQISIFIHLELLGPLSCNILIR